MVRLHAPSSGYGWKNNHDWWTQLQRTVYPIEPKPKFKDRYRISKLDRLEAQLKRKKEAYDRSLVADMQVSNHIRGRSRHLLTQIDRIEYYIGKEVMKHELNAITASQTQEAS